MWEHFSGGCKCSDLGYNGRDAGVWLGQKHMKPCIQNCSNLFHVSYTSIKLITKTKQMKQKKVSTCGFLIKWPTMKISGHPLFQTPEQTLWTCQKSLLPDDENACSLCINQSWKWVALEKSEVSIFSYLPGVPSMHVICVGEFLLGKQPGLLLQWEYLTCERPACGRRLIQETSQGLVNCHRKPFGSLDAVGLLDEVSRWRSLWDPSWEPATWPSKSTTESANVYNRAGGLAQSGQSRKKKLVKSKSRITEPTHWKLADNMQGSSVPGMNVRGSSSYINLQNSFDFLGYSFIQYYFYNI